MNDPVTAAVMRRSFPEFCKGMVPGFQMPAHVMLMCEQLERLERRDIRRLMFSIPVRHGKSWLAQLFSAWVAGRRPTEPQIIASYSQALAERNTRLTKHHIESERWPFGSVRLSADSTAVGRFSLQQGADVFATGTGGGVTGRGMSTAILDDCLADGLSEVEQKTVGDWYSEIFFPRLEPDGIVLCIGARFAPNDLSGQILDSPDGKNWTVIELPAIAGEDDVLGRAVGEALWPERFSLDELLMRKTAMSTIAWEAQFQQNPAPRTGRLFSSSWLQNRYTETPPLRRACVYLDSASKTGTANDESAFIHLGTDGVNYYVLGGLAGKWTFPELKHRSLAFWAESVARTPTAIFAIEDAASGTALAQSIKETTNVPVIAVPATQSKLVRAEAVSAIFESGRVFFQPARNSLSR